MSFYSHIATFAGRPVVEVTPGAPLPDVHGPVAWRLSYWEYEGDDEYGPSEEFGRLLGEFVDAADPAAVEALVIGSWGYAAFKDAPIAYLCGVADRLPALRALFLGDITSDECEASWIRQGDLTPLLAAYPALEVLRVRGTEEIDLDPVRHEALRELAFETGGLPSGIVRSVLGSDLPALAHLELWLGVERYGGDAEVDDLAPLLSGERLPALTHLGLRNSEKVDEVATALATAPLLARLDSLDLSLGTLTDAGAQALLSGQSLAHLRRLDLHHHYLSEEMMARLRAELPGVEVDVSDQQTEEQYGRYTAVDE